MKEVWPRFRQAARRPVGSPIMLPILADDPYWNAKTPDMRLSSIRNVHRWLADDLGMAPDYWVMTTYPCCDPARDGFCYLGQIVRILGPENGSRIISTDLKGAGHDLAACIVDKTRLSNADVLRWHFGKVREYGLGGWVVGLGLPGCGGRAHRPARPAGPMEAGAGARGPREDSPTTSGPGMTEPGSEAA